LALPSAVSDYLLRLASEERRPAFLAIDPEGNLSESGGSLRSYGLDKLERGTAVTRHAFFLEGMIPLQGQPIFLPCVKAGADLVADIHIFKHGGVDWVVLLDAVSHEIQQRIFLQKTNQLSLASERLARSARPDSTLAELLNALGVLTLEHVERDRFSVLAPLPSWFPEIWPDALAASGDFRLPKQSSFLSNFLIDAQRFWDKKSSGCVKSGLWSEGGSRDVLFL
jgi:hypothetical protein